VANLETSVTWSEYADRLREYVGACGVEDDTTLEELLNVAVVWLDAYLENPFVDSDCLDIPIPLGVLNAVWETVKILFDTYANALTPGLTGVRTRDLSQNWGGAGFKIDTTILETVTPRVYPYRVNIWR